MKTIFNLKSLFFISFFFFASCYNQTGYEPIEKYCGGIIILKSNNIANTIDIKYNGKIIKDIYLYDIDYNKYDVGDTIKCTKADSILYSTKIK